MKITVQITVQSDEGQAEAVRQVACLERGPLQPETLGLPLAEARSILAGLEQNRIQQQVAEFILQEQRCPCCGRPRACKDCQSIVFRTPFGKLKLVSPRLYRCRCEGGEGPKSFNPSAGLLPERTSPEHWHTWKRSLRPWCLTGSSFQLLQEALPIGQILSTAAIR